MEVLWIVPIGLIAAFLPSALYLFFRWALTPLGLWPWELVTVYQGNRFVTMQRKDLWHSEKP